MNKIDPYNNAPPPRDGGGCSGGSCGIKSSSRPTPPQTSSPVGRTTGMSQRPARTPGRPDLQTENAMLWSDLQLAIGYIRQLGGTWPPPGH